MRFLLSCFALSILNFYCTNAHENASGSSNTLETLLNQNFLAITDTAAYDHLSLLPAPNEPKSAGKSKGEYVICVADSLASSEGLVLSIKKGSIYGSLSRKYKQLLNPGKATIVTNFDLSKVTNTGLYRLYPQSKCDPTSPNVVGKLQLYQLFFNNENAILFVTIEGKFKSGRTLAYLLEKKNSKWIVEKKEIIEIW